MKYCKQAEKMYIYDKELLKEIGFRLIYLAELCFTGKRNMSGIEKDLRLNVIKKFLAKNF